VGVESQLRNHDQRLVEPQKKADADMLTE